MAVHERLFRLSMTDEAGPVEGRRSLPPWIGALAQFGKNLQLSLTQSLCHWYTAEPVFEEAGHELLGVAIRHLPERGQDRVGAGLLKGAAQTQHALAHVRNLPEPGLA